MQVAAGWKVEVAPAFVQDAATQAVLLGSFWQTPPWQRPVSPQVPAAVHWPSGAGPLGRAVQVPLPERLQTWQGSQPLLVQQTLSMQLFVPHSWPRVQLPPGPFLAWHWAPALGQK